MEISEIILTQALGKSGSSSIHIELKEVLKKLEAKTLSDFLNVERGEEMRKIDNEIRDILNSNIYYNTEFKSDKVNVIAQIIFTITEYLRTGVSNADVKAILIFLGVNCYLQVEVEKLLPKTELEELYTKSVSEKIIEILKIIKLETKALPDAPNHEKAMINDSLEGFSLNNITKTYNLIEGLERNGRGFHFNFLLEHLISFLCGLNFSHFINALSHLKNPIDYVFYFQNLKKGNLLKIANETSISNRWLNFEIIRQIVKKEDNENIDELEVKAIKNVLYRIEIIDFDFLKQSVIYFQKSRLFNASLGIFLSSASNAKIQEIVSDFVIDKYSTNIRTRDALREYFIKSVSDDRLYILDSLIFNKWKNYYENILTKEDFYQNSLLLTDFANFISNYHTHSTSEKDLLSNIECLIDKISFIDSEWTASKSEQITKFHLYHSELFLLTFSYRNKRLNYPQILANYKRIISDKIQSLRYISVETEHYFEQGKRNIDFIEEEKV